jgi:NAD(P)-dependent dehydrogenase (short-subunit alcohol dehydrogenase family)
VTEKAVPADKSALPKRKIGARTVPRRRTFMKPRIMPTHNTPLTDRVCVLTGASGHLGTEFIKRFSLDYKIVAIHNNTEVAPPQKLVDPLFSSVPIEVTPVDSIRADLSKPDEIDALVDEVLARYGKIDLLINGACHRGYWLPLVKSGALEQVEMSFNINVLAPMRLVAGFTQKFWAHQTWQDNTDANRNIINVSSTAGSYIYPDTGQGIYSSSKAALNYASHHLASELWEYGVRVNVIAPNTFPHIVPTHRVLDQMIALDQSADTGQLILVDRE